MRRSSSVRALVVGVLLAAFVPATAFAQAAPNEDESAVLALLPGATAQTLSTALMQLQNGMASGNPSDAANAQQAWSLAFGRALVQAENNLNNDIGMTRNLPVQGMQPNPALQAQIAADQAVIQNLIMLNTLAMSQGGSGSTSP